MRLYSWERTENTVRRGAKKQSTHRRVRFHVFIFGRKEIVANLFTDNARPWELHIPHVVFPSDVYHIQISTRNP